MYNLYSFVQWVDLIRRLPSGTGNTQQSDNIINNIIYYNDAIRSITFAVWNYCNIITEQLDSLAMLRS